MTILTVPSFFITAISSALIPEISKNYLKKNYANLKKRLKEALFFSLLIGISYSIVLVFFADKLLSFLYSTNLGLNYVKVLAPIFPLFYIEAILMSYLQALDKAKITMNITIFGVIVKLITLAITSLIHIGMYSLIISEIANIFIVVFLNIYFTYKTTKNL